MLKLIPEITKKYILSKLTEKEIFDKYLGNLSYGELFCSPLRKDKNPTCNLYLTDTNRTLFIDFSGDFKGDVFSFIMKFNNCSFKEALLIIAYDFNLSNRKVSVNKLAFKEKIRIEKVLGVTWQKLNQKDIQFWKSYGISVNTLKKFNVCSVKHVWLNNAIISSYSTDSPIYGYSLENKLKFYYPYKKDTRFLSDFKGIQGLEHLPQTGDLLIITKSYKDVMALWEDGIYAVAPQSETINLSESFITEMHLRFKKVLFIYDFDLAGIRSINKLRKRIPINYTFFTNGKFKTTKYPGKDYTDIIKNKSKEFAKSSLLSMINNIKWLYKK